MPRSIAVEFSSPGKVGLTIVDVPAPRGDELLVRVRACGICMLDVNTFTGKLPAAFPRVTGHEGVGVVDRVGADVSAFRPGDKVAFLGVPALSEYCLVKAERAAPIPLETEDFVPWIAEPASCVINGARSARVEPGDTVVLIGAGYMGLLLVQALPRQIMEHFVVIDVDEDRLALARRFGAAITLNPEQVDVVAEVRKLTGASGVAVYPEERDAVGRLLGRDAAACLHLTPEDVPPLERALGAREARVHTTLSPQDVWMVERVLARVRSGADIVIEAAGARGILDTAGRMVRRGGRLSIFSFHTAREEVDLPLWHTQGFEVQNPAPGFSRNSAKDLQDAVRLMRAGMLDQSLLITHRFAHTAIQEALELTAARPKGYIKAAVTFD
jgi:threonine dehydrogenase-like Zn-dependent dehydrogenase